MCVCVSVHYVRSETMRWYCGAQFVQTALTHKWISNLVRVYVQMNKNVLKRHKHIDRNLAFHCSNFNADHNKIQAYPIQFYGPLFDCKASSTSSYGFFFYVDNIKDEWKRRKHLDFFHLFLPSEFKYVLNRYLWYEIIPNMKWNDNLWNIQGRQ